MNCVFSATEVDSQIPTVAVGRHGSGRLVRCPGGYEAYVPNPLPPEMEFSPSLLRSLSDADRMIGKLAGEGRSLQNPHLLMRPFIKREAVLSSVK